MQKPCNKCKYAYSYKTPSGQTRYDSSKWGIVGTVCRECEKYKKYSNYLESRRQYFRGEVITSVDKFLELQRKGEDLFYLNNSIRHIGWLNSMQFRNLTSMITNGRICRAIKK